MSLLSDSMSEFHIIVPVRAADGEGGFNTTWEESTSIQAAVLPVNDPQARIAEHETTGTSYLVFAWKPSTLDFHDVIKRASDGKYFRIVSDKHEHESPLMSSLNLALYNAEKWELME